MIVSLVKFIPVFVLIAFPAFAGAPQATVMVRPASDVAAEDVTLQDIAAVQAEDEALADKLGATSICRSPLPGKSRRITREQIIIALRRQGLPDGSVNLLCPPEIGITRSGTIVTGQALFEATQQFATEAGNWPGSIVVESARLPADQTVPSGKLKIRVREGAIKLRKGRNSIPVEVVVDDKVYTTTHISVLIRVFAPVLVSTGSIARTTEIDSSNSEMQEREITNLPEDLVFELPSTGAIAAVPIAEGSVIRQNWTSEPVAIRSGEPVTIAVVGDSVRITDRGAAISDGRPGDRIKVRLLGDVREVHGTVVSPGLVEIQIGRRN
jgi:flagellar basal body P-ring formation protein FlgA